MIFKTYIRLKVYLTCIFPPIRRENKFYLTQWHSLTTVSRPADSVVLICL
jgi:hypothetical protein